MCWKILAASSTCWTRPPTADRAGHGKLDESTLRLIEARRARRAQGQGNNAVADQPPLLTSCAECLRSSPSCLPSAFVPIPIITDAVATAAGVAQRRGAWQEGAPQARPDRATRPRLRSSAKARANSDLGRDYLGDAGDWPGDQIVVMVRSSADGGVDGRVSHRRIRPGSGANDTVPGQLCVTAI
jgi:hypothetical protein